LNVTLKCNRTYSDETPTDQPVRLIGVERAHSETLKTFSRRRRRNPTGTDTFSDSLEMV